MLGQYLPLLALLFLAAIFAAGSFIASGLLAPRNPTEPKSSPYECGIVPSREAPERFPVRFFLVAMIFIVFDIEIIFFYPYAVAREGLGPFGLGLILVFSFAVFESFVYLIGNGALDWGPSTRRRGVDDIASAPPVPTAGVRLVGLEGRGAQLEKEVA
jgi:NADH-quinone oxidoreductase subunit A